MSASTTERSFFKGSYNPTSDDIARLRGAPILNLATLNHDGTSLHTKGMPYNLLVPFASQADAQTALDNLVRELKKPRGQKGELGSILPPDSFTVLMQENAGTHDWAIELRLHDERTPQVNGKALDDFMTECEKTHPVGYVIPRNQTSRISYTDLMVSRNGHAAHKNGHCKE